MLEEGLSESASYSFKRRFIKDSSSTKLKGLTLKI